MAQEQHLPNPTVEAADHQDIINRRVQFASGYIIEKIHSAKSAPTVSLLYGTMGGAKTTTVAEINDNLTDRRVTVFKKQGLDRNGSDQFSIWLRNRHMITKGVAAVNGLHEVAFSILSGDHEPGSVIALEEAQFMGSGTDAESLIMTARAKGVHIVADCLGADFRTYPLEGTAVFAKHADHAFLMTGWDNLDRSRSAEATFRVVGVDANGNVLHQDGLTYMRDREMVRRAMDGLAAVGLLDRFSINKPEEFPDVETCYGIPSLLSDPVLAIGAKRYFTLTMDNWHSVYRAAGIDLSSHPNIKPIKSLYPGIKRFDWEQIGLAN